MIADLNVILFAGWGVASFVVGFLWVCLNIDREDDPKTIACLENVVSGCMVAFFAAGVPRFLHLFNNDTIFEILSAPTTMFAQAVFGAGITYAAWCMGRWLGPWWLVVPVSASIASALAALELWT